MTNAKSLRKSVSLVLIVMMIASSANFPFTNTMPVAEAAHNANLFVSAESSLFKNTFGGPMVVEIVINDPALMDTDEAKGEPDVTVNGKDVRMAQASDGLWYAYIADRTQAQRADATTAAGIGLDFGVFCGPTTNAGDTTASPSVVTFTD